MSPQMVEAVRKEAFMQGYVACVQGLALEKGTPLTDEQLLDLLPKIDAIYAAWRKSRSP